MARSARGLSEGSPSRREMRSEAAAPNQVPAVPIGGWLSPDGRFWPGPDPEHQSAAQRIVDEVGLGDGRDAEQVVENAGWVHVGESGRVLYVRDGYAQAQIDTLFDLACTHPSMSTRIMDALEEHRQRSCSQGHEQHSGAERLPASGIVAAGPGR
jgi:hypothetical protein